MPARAKPWPKWRKAEGLGCRRRNHIARRHTKRGESGMEFIHQRDIHQAIGVFQKLGAFRDLGARDHLHPIHQMPPKAQGAAERGIIGGTQQARNAAGWRRMGARVFPLRRHGQENILPHAPAGFFQHGTT